MWRETARANTRCAIDKAVELVVRNNLKVQQNGNCFGYFVILGLKV